MDPVNVNKKANRPVGKKTWRETRHGSNAWYKQLSQACLWLQVIVKQISNVVPNCILLSEE
jgi:hypothetical protein